MYSSVIFVKTESWNEIDYSIVILPNLPWDYGKGMENSAHTSIFSSPDLFTTYDIFLIWLIRSCREGESRPRVHSLLAYKGFSYITEWKALVMHFFVMTSCCPLCRPNSTLSMIMLGK